MELKGTIKTITEVVEGVTKDGKAWKKVVFVIANNEGYNDTEQIFAFEIFGEEKVDKFIQYNSVDKEVVVSFNIKTNEWQGKYFTSLQAWKVFKAEDTEPLNTSEPVEEDLPF